MNSKTTQTFELSEQDACYAIQDWIEKRYGKTESIIKVRFDTKVVTTGYGPAEQNTHVVVITASRDV